jgi:hypothetical protein
MKKEERGGREDVGRRGEEGTENTLYRDRPSGGGRRRKEKEGGGGRREEGEEGRRKSKVKILARKGKEKREKKTEKVPGSRTWPSLFVGFLEPEYFCGTHESDAEYFGKRDPCPGRWCEVCPLVLPSPLSQSSLVPPHIFQGERSKRRFRAVTKRVEYFLFRN